MSDYELTLLFCFVGLGYAALFSMWILTSRSKAARWALDKVERINDLLTFGKGK